MQSVPEGMGKTKGKRATEGADSGLLDGELALPPCNKSSTWISAKMLLAVTFVAISMAFSIYLVNDKGGKDDDFEAKVLAKYSTLFRTVKEHEAFKAKFWAAAKRQNIMKAAMNKDHPAEFCQHHNGEMDCFDDRAPADSLQKREQCTQWEGKDPYPIHHSCCSSVVSFICPDTGLTTDDDIVTIIQFPNHKQIFQIESC
ncbi:hypothetical protein PoB_005161300, partial [Plakobranchus ocellatus]